MTLYWVGGSSTWNATVGTKWATTSGGAGGAAIPTAADDVVFDANSGASTITTSGTTTDLCRSLNCTGFTGTLSHAAATTITIGDATAGVGNVALLLVAGMTYTIGSNSSAILSFVSTSATVQTIAFGGKTTSSVTFNGAGGSWQFTSTHTTGSGGSLITLTTGTLDTNGQTCTWGSLSASNTNTRSLLLGSSGITVTSGSGTVWNMNVATGLTFNAGTSTITISDTGVSAKQLFGSNVYNNLVITGGGSGPVTVGSTSTFNSISIGAPKTIVFTAGTTKTVTNFVATGTPGNIITITSSSAGSQFTLAKSNGTVSCDYLSLQDSAATGGAAWFAGTNSTNVSGNTGWNFSAPIELRGNFFHVM